MISGTKPLQAHMRYVVDLEGYSFVFRPDRESTEIIQFTRPSLSPTTLKAKLRVVSSELPAKYSSLSTLNRSMLLLFTLKSPSLELRNTHLQKNPKRITIAFLTRQQKRSLFQMMVLIPFLKLL